MNLLFFASLQMSFCKCDVQQSGVSMFLAAFLNKFLHNMTMPRIILSLLHEFVILSSSKLVSTLAKCYCGHTALMDQVEESLKDVEYDM